MQVTRLDHLRRGTRTRSRKPSGRTESRQGDDNRRPVARLRASLAPVLGFSPRRRTAASRRRFSDDPCITRSVKSQKTIHQAASRDRRHCSTWLGEDGPTPTVAKALLKTMEGVNWQATAGARAIQGRANADWSYTESACGSRGRCVVGAYISCWFDGKERRTSSSAAWLSIQRDDSWLPQAGI